MYIILLILVTEFVLDQSAFRAVLKLEITSGSVFIELCFYQLYTGQCMENVNSNNHESGI